MNAQVHWRDRAITASECISDGFEVLKAYGARIAEWILFFCLIANIIEIFPLPEPFASVFGNLVLGIQSVTLDIAGFGLASMGDHARRRGDVHAARKAGGMGWTLICVMILTVSLVTLSIIVPATKPTVDIIEKVLILARVIVTVIYGHVVHSLRNAGEEFDNRVSTLQKEVDTLQQQLQAKQKEVDSGQVRLSTVQTQVSTLEDELDTARRDLSTVQRKLDTEQQRVSSLEQELDTGQGDTAGLRRELSAAAIELESLRGRLAAKTREVEEMQVDLSSVVSLRRELNTAQVASQELQAQLDTKARELDIVQSMLSSEQQLVSSLKKQLSSVQSKLDAQVSTVQTAKASTGHTKADTGRVGKVDTGQEKIVQLDTHRLDAHRKTGRGDQLAEQIKKLIDAEPGISGRAIAARVGCSPTTANDWKKFFENGGQLDEGAM